MIASGKRLDIDDGGIDFSLAIWLDGIVGKAFLAQHRCVPLFSGCRNNLRKADSVDAGIVLGQAQCLDILMKSPATKRAVMSKEATNAAQDLLLCLHPLLDAA